MRRAVVLVLDGLRRDMLSQALTPNLAAHAAATETFSAHRSMFPSATRVVSASFATGCYPARHELQGNSLVLNENGRLVAHDAGHPDFLQHKRRVTGRSLAMPTLAERVKDHGGAVIFSNVSPGAAYAHDPDGHGWVYHRAGSFGPGRRRLEKPDAVDVTLDAAGDRALAERFTDDVLFGRRPALALLWLGEPDASSHAHPLGSPAHLEAMQEADRTAGVIMEAVGKLREGGDDVLFIVCSDHGHQTVRGVIDINGALVTAGLKAGADSDDVIAVSNGTSALVYLAEAKREKTAAIGAFLAAQPWVGRVIGAEGLGKIGQVSRHGLAFAVDMAATEEPNAFGIPGQSYEAMPAPGKSGHLGCGQHGGLARFEQAPFLMVQGPGLKAGAMRREPTSAIDHAPTILTHLGLPATGMDGRALQG
ncbi:MAG: alkaline phosphatase family protein [Sphingomonadales bacterium]|nr:alkaline phosphatase family protein [Sphingomonadales bacterium]